MDIRAIDLSETHPAYASGPARSPLTWLHDLSLDLLLLQRQLVLSLTDQDSDETQALMAACCISERLAHGYALFQKRGVETAAIASFRRYFDDADAVVRRLRCGVATDQTVQPVTPRGEAAYGVELVRGLGMERMLRLGELDTPVARTGKAVLFAADLFLVAAHQLLAAISPRHEPETSAAFERQLVGQDRFGAEPALALTA